MDNELEHIFAVNFGDDFPLDDIREIGDRLIATGALVPGYIPAPNGMLDLMVVTYAQQIEGWEFVILPDKNLVSRMARLARSGAPDVRDGPTQLAADLMAFAQAMNFHIEPSIAVHEEAHKLSNEAAYEELQWFRAADAGGKADEWVELAQGRRQRMSAMSPGERADVDLALPLKRWRRNYVVALKIAELEYTKMPAKEKVITLLQWMYNDFIVAGPAAIFAAYYFAPNARRAGMIKQLHSQDRDRAIAGIRNAAWDITYLSDFVRCVGEVGSARTRYILATGDIELARIAPLLIQKVDSEEPVELIDALGKWWPEKAAHAMATRLADFLAKVQEDSYRRQRHSVPIENWIAQGEAKVRDFIPK